MTERERDKRDGATLSKLTPPFALLCTCDPWVIRSFLVPIWGFRTLIKLFYCCVLCIVIVIITI